MLLLLLLLLPLLLPAVAPQGYAQTSPTVATPCGNSSYAPQYNRLSKCLRCQSGLEEAPDSGLVDGQRASKRVVCSEWLAWGVWRVWAGKLVWVYIWWEGWARGGPAPCSRPEGATLVAGLRDGQRASKRVVCSEWLNLGVKGGGGVHPSSWA